MKAKAPARKTPTAKAAAPKGATPKPEAYAYHWRSRENLKRGKA